MDELEEKGGGRHSSENCIGLSLVIIASKVDTTKEFHSYTTKINSEHKLNARNCKVHPSVLTPETIQPLASLLLPTFRIRQLLNLYYIYLVDPCFRDSLVIKCRRFQFQCNLL